MANLTTLPIKQIKLQFPKSSIAHFRKLSMAEPDPEWSQLPTELLHLMSQYLSDTDILRFRSVCSTWRSAIPPLVSTANGRFSILPNHSSSDTAWGFYLSKRTIYSLQSPSNENEIKSWIIKLERDNPTRMHLVHPLTRSVFKLMPDSFPRYFSFLNLRIKELGHEYTLQYINFSPLASSIGEAGNLYMEKVAVCLNFSGADKNGFVLLTIHVSGKLVIYRSVDKKWTIINDLPSPYDDVIFREGRFYAIDSTGRTVIVNLDEGGSPSVSVVAHSIFGGDKKFLVDSFGDLLLVDKYLTVDPEDDLGYIDDFEFYEEFDCYASERTVKFKVFRLDENAEQWVEVTNLGDKLLFLGDNCAFSASASEVFGDNGCKGNCIFFTDQFFCGREDDWVWKSRGIGVFDLESGSIGPIDCHDGYSDMFWPPPAWVCSDASVEAELEQLAI